MVPAPEQCHALVEPCPLHFFCYFQLVLVGLFYDVFHRNPNFLAEVPGDIILGVVLAVRYLRFDNSCLKHFGADWRDLSLLTEQCHIFGVPHLYPQTSTENMDAGK